MSDAPSESAPYLFSHAEQLFIHGRLEDAQREAERGYVRFLYSDPISARRFQLLEATAMAWRGLNEDLLSVLSDDRIPWESHEDSIERLALQGTALTHLHRLDDAGSIISAAEYLCSQRSSRECGAVIRARGVLFYERGEMRQAAALFRSSLDFSRSSKDGMLEATALLNLGSVAIQQERHEEALSYLTLSYAKATELGAAAIQESAIGNQGWEQYSLGNVDKALDVFGKARIQAASLGDVSYEILWVTYLARA